MDPLRAVGEKEQSRCLTVLLGTHIFFHDDFTALDSLLPLLHYSDRYTKQNKSGNIKNVTPASSRSKEVLPGQLET